MTTQPDEHTQRMNTWFQQSFDLHMRRHLASIDEFAEEVGTITGKTNRMLFEILKIMKYLSINDHYSRGGIDQIIRSYKAEYGIADRGNDLAVEIIDSTERTTERRTSKRTVRRSVSDVVDSIDLVDDEGGKFIVNDKFEEAKADDEV